MVAVRALDEIAGGMLGPLGIKIDMQGFESQVLNGASVTARRSKYLEMELSLASMYEGESLYREMLDRLDGLGFRLVMVEPVCPISEPVNACSSMASSCRESWPGT
jgi:hypothetical protein